MPADMDELVDKLRKVPLLQSLGEHALFNVASHLETVEFGPHDRIIRQGDFGDCFFIIEEGEVEVYVHGAYVVNLKEGTFFGEQALLTNAPRNASIVAAENGCKCLMMSRTNFETYLGPLRDHMERVNERRQMVNKRKKMMKSKLGSRMAALDRLINPDLAAELDAQEDADNAVEAATPAKGKNRGGDSGGGGGGADDGKGGGRGRRSRVPVSRRHRGTIVARAKARAETWQSAVDFEAAMRKRIVERNAELLHGAAMARQTSEPPPDAVVQAALKSGTSLVHKTAANTAPPPPPPRRHALQHNCHSWVVWEGHWELNAVDKTLQATQDTWLKATTAKSYQLRESQKRRVFMGEIWKFVGTPVRIHNHVQITIEGTEPLFTPAASKLSRVMLRSPTIASTLWQKTGLLNDAESWRPYHFALVGPVLFRFPAVKSTAADWAIVLSAEEHTLSPSFRPPILPPHLGLYRAVKGLNKGFTFALADENRYSSDVRSPKARHRRRPSQDLELERYRGDANSIPGLHVFATPSQALHRMWVAAISHVIEPQDWHRHSESTSRKLHGADSGDVPLHGGAGGGPGRGRKQKKRSHNNPFERRQRVLERFRAAVQQVLRSLHTGRSIVGRTNTSHLHVLRRRIQYEDVTWLEKQLKSGLLHQLAALVLHSTRQNQFGLGGGGGDAADEQPSPFDVGTLTLPLTAIECFRAVVNRKKGMQALLDSGGQDLLQIACFAFGLHDNAAAIAARAAAGAPPPLFNMMLFCQVADILISLSAFSEKGRRVVESVMNQMALFWLLTMEAEVKQQQEQQQQKKKQAQQQQDADGADASGSGGEDRAGSADGEAARAAATKVPATPKDKMWGLLNFFLHLTRHPQRGRRCMPLQAKEKLLCLLNTLVMSSGGAVHRGSVRAQLKQCGFDRTRVRLRRTCEQVMLHDTLTFIVNDIDAKIRRRSGGGSGGGGEAAGATSSVAERFMSVFSGLSRDGELTEKEFVEALLVFTNSRNDNTRRSDFINAFYMLDRSCDGKLSYVEIETAVTEFECVSAFHEQRRRAAAAGGGYGGHVGGGGDGDGDDLQTAEAVLRQLDVYETWLEQDEKQEAEILGKLSIDDLAQCLGNRMNSIDHDGVRGAVRKVVEKLIVTTHNHEAMTSPRSFLQRMRLQLDSMLGELPGEEAELAAAEAEAAAAAAGVGADVYYDADEPEELASARRAAAASIAAKHAQYEVAAAAAGAGGGSGGGSGGGGGAPGSPGSREGGGKGGGGSDGGSGGGGGADAAAAGAGAGPDLSKYTRMLRMGLPRGAVEQKMRSDGLDPVLLDGPGSGGGGGAAAAGGPPPPPGGAPGVPPPPPGMGGPPMPPGMAGGPPPPPPPGAMLGGAAGKKKKNAKKSKLRKVNWPMLDYSETPGTCWETLERRAKSGVGASEATIPTDQIDALFTIKEKKKKGKGKRKKKKKTTKKSGGGGGRKKLELLDDKRAFQLQLALKKIAHLPHDELAYAVLNADDAVLTSEVLETVKFMSPTADEERVVAAWLKDPAHKPDDLDAPSAFMVQMRTVPRMGEKVHAIITRANWQATAADMRRDMQTVVAACDEMLTSEHMHGWLQLVLAVGNYMNAGTNRGNCVGFELQFLMNLRDVKVTDTNTDIKNLLQLLVDVSHRADEQGIVSKLDCAHIQPATRVAVKHLVSQLRILEKSVGRVEAEVAAVVAAAQDNETRFGLAMKLFINKARADLQLLHAAASDMEEKLEQVRKYYAQDPTEFESETFFGLVHAIATTLQSETAQLLKYRDIAEKREKVAIARKKRQAALARRKKINREKKRREKLYAPILDEATGGGDAAEGQGGARGAAAGIKDKGCVDNLVSKVSNGSIFKDLAHQRD